MVNIVPRHVWCDIPANRKVRKMSLPVHETWLHHGAAGFSDVATANQYANWHIRHKGWDDVGYSFLIAQGQILAGRGHDGVGAHTVGRNSRSHGIVVCGDYRIRDIADRDVTALAALLRHGKTQGWWPGIFAGGHRDAPGATTTCPGGRLHARIADINARATGAPPKPSEGPIVEAVVTGIQESLNAAGHRDHQGRTLAVDGQWGPRTQSAFVRAIRGSHFPADVTITGTLQSR